MDAEGRRDVSESFWLALLMPASRRGIPHVIDKWCQLFELPDWLVVGSEPWDLSKVERNKPELAKYLQRYAVLHKWVQPTANNHWDKLSTLIDFVE